MPRAFADVKLHLVAPGYVHSVAADAVYVHFLGRVSGRAGLPQLSDVFVSDPRQHFQAGQSVRAQVVQVRRVHITPASATAERLLVCYVFCHVQRCAAGLGCACTPKAAVEPHSALRQLPQLQMDIYGQALFWMLQDAAQPPEASLPYTL